MKLTAADVLGDAVSAAMPPDIGGVRPETVTIDRAPVLMRLVWGTNTGAITLGSHVFIAPDILHSGGRQLRNLVIHELVHVNQWSSRGPVLFLVEYVGQYLLARLRGGSHHVAYMSISAEVKARRLASETASLLDDD